MTWDCPIVTRLMTKSRMMLLMPSWYEPHGLLCAHVTAGVTLCIGISMSLHAHMLSVMLV